MTDNNTLLSVRDLVVEYTSEGRIIHAVNGVSLNIKKGETLGLVGETGAGKTTIAKSILRILSIPPAKIAGGEIFYQGEDILKMSEPEVRKIRGEQISMIFQDPMTALNPTMRVGEQIADVLETHRKMSRKEAWDEAARILETVGISSDRIREYPHQFSGGMKQRVVIAIALACDPELLLADEPTTALDVTIQAQVLELIGQLKKDRQMALLLITHDLGIVAENCDNVAVIYAGEIVEYGTLEDVFVRTAHPYTMGLFDSLPDISKDTKHLKPIQGQPPDPSDLPQGCSFNPRCPYATEECRSGNVEKIQLSDTHMCACRNYDKILNGKENEDGSVG